MKTSRQIRSVNCRGLQTGWIESGTPGKPGLLMLHGFPDTPTVWGPISKLLSKKFHIVSPYARGLEPSEKGLSVARYSATSCALDAITVRDAVFGKNTRVTIVGHDLGAVVATEAAIISPDKFANLVLLNGFGIGMALQRKLNPFQLAKSWYMFVMQIPYAPEWIFKRTSERIIRGAYKKNFVPTEIARALGDNQGLPDQLQHYRAFMREAIAQVNQPVQRVSIPTSVIWGIRDTFLLTPTRHEMEVQYPNLAIRSLNCGHWPQLQDPEITSEIIGRAGSNV